MPDVIVFGATGYTGGLVARALHAAGTSPILAGRDPQRLAGLSSELGDARTLVADASDGRAVAGALSEGDVLVSTVGPFMRHGQTALEAARATGAHYVDSTGEAAFVRHVFDVGGDASGCLLTAFGYDYVPGNLAAGLALREAGAAATAVRVGYFMTGGSGPGMLSSGTLATLAGQSLEAAHTFRGGALRLVRPAAEVRGHLAGGRRRRSLSVGGTEHLSLPRLHPSLADVYVGVGWFGTMSPVLSALAAAVWASARLPGVGTAMRALAAPLARRTGAGPDEERRERSGSLVVADALDGPDGEVLAHVELRGVNGYTLTGNAIAWAARQLAQGTVTATGAMGPVEAFGLERLEAGMEECGLQRSA